MKKNAREKHQKKHKSLINSFSEAMTPKQSNLKKDITKGGFPVNTKNMNIKP